MTAEAPVLLEPWLLVVEGKADAGFFRQLLRERGLGRIQVLDAGSLANTGGRSAFGKALRSLTAATGFSQVKGLLLFGDADDDAAAAFAELAAVVAGHGAFARPVRDSVLAVTPGSRSAMVATLPGNGRPGALETLLLDVVADRFKVALDCVDALVDCRKIGGWKPRKLEKARIQAYICTSLESDPNAPVGHVWSRDATLIPVSHAEFDWLEDLIRNATS